MAEINFEFYGVSVRLVSSSEEALSELSRDFAWFLSDSNGNEPSIRLEMFLSAPPQHKIPTGYTDVLAPRIFDEGNVRTVVQPGGGLVVHDFSSDRGQIYCADPHRLHELTYILLLSRIGERLDRLGMHRVHGLGFEWNGAGVLFLAPVGGGKTTLAIGLLRKSDVRLLSEDTPIVDRAGNLWPFPVRFGIASGEHCPEIPTEFQRVFRRRDRGTKVLIDVNYAAGRWVSQAPVAPRFLCVGSGFSSETVMAPRPALWSLSALFTNLLVGWGIPQGREYLIRSPLETFIRLSRVTCSRAGTIFSLIRRCRVLWVRLGPTIEGTLPAFQKVFEAPSD